MTSILHGLSLGDSKKYKWTSWVIYDQKYWQEMETRRETNWVDIKTGMYTQIWTISVQQISNVVKALWQITWLMIAPMLLGNPSDRGWPPARQKTKTSAGSIMTEIGNVRTFKNCKFSHICRICKGRHPQFLCQAGQAQKDSSSSK